MADSVFKPLGMNHTFMGAVPEQEQDVAQGYTRTRGQLHTMAPPWSRAHVPAGAATHTTAEDVSRYFSALLARGEAPGGQVLSARGLERMWTPAVMTQNGPSMNGLGWVLSEESGRKRVSHGGNTIISSSSFNLVPSEGLAVGVLSNRNTPVTASLRALGKDDLNAVQVFSGLVAEAERSKRLTRLTRSQFVRELYEALPEGWPTKMDDAIRFKIAKALGFWTSFTPETHKERVRQARAALRATPPSPGWRPLGPDDELLLTLLPDEEA